MAAPDDAVAAPAPRDRVAGGLTRGLAPTGRLAALLVGCAALALVAPPALAVLAACAALGLGLADALAARRAAPRAERTLDRVLSRGVPAELHVVLRERGGSGGRRRGAVRLRQPAHPDLRVAAPEGDERLETTVVGVRRGRHLLAPVAVRTTGPLGLGRADHEDGGEREVLVYPDLRAARRLVVALREGRRREAGVRTRGPIGLGTEFERIRDYLPDDDIRQVNWRATARLGRPMSNQHRTETDRRVLLVLDCGRLMGAPLGDGRTRLDAALDAATAVALVADELGDRCGLVAFDDELRVLLRPDRGGGAACVRAAFALEPSDADADFELAVRAAGRASRQLVLLLSDLLEPAAARPLVGALGALTRRHAVVVAGVRDPDVERLATAPPAGRADVLAAAAALDVLAAREAAVAAVRRTGAQVLEADAAALPAACVGAYLRAKARAVV